MSLGPAPAGRLGAPAPIAPTHRPPWLLILSSITLVYGGLMLVSGLTALRNPAAAAKFPITRPLAPEEEALTRELMAVSGQIVARHSGAIRARAAVSMVVALFMLYSAAAALSRDRHGRAATLLAAWLGIAYQVATLPLVIPIASDYAEASAPILVRMVAADNPEPASDKGKATGAAPSTAAGDKSDPPRPEALASFTQTVFLGVPIATAVLGVLGSLLLIAYFGGRRGRALYGLPPRG
ncbi:MAG TPA: hypothetical protein VFH68_16300 [Polyangia bacterium]|jgi:hypothetical protein|nr:hypothetical protein [Polyangia bacterium]